MEKAFYNEPLKLATTAIAKEKTKENLGQLAASLYATSLLIPAIWNQEPVKQKNGQLLFKPNTQFQFAMTKDAKNQTYILMFSNYEEFNKWNDENRFQPLIIPFRQFMNLVEGSLKGLKGVLIDVTSTQITVGMDFLRGINVTQDIKLEKKQFDNKLVLKDPENADEFIKVIQETSKQVKEVNAIYLKEREGHWLIIVDTDKEDTAIFQQLGRLWSKSAGKQMEFIFGSLDVSKQIIAITKPVYKR